MLYKKKFKDGSVAIVGENIVSQEYKLAAFKPRGLGKKAPSIPLSDEQRLYLKKIKHMDIADMRLNGMTLTLIAKNKKLTRQRISQILKECFYDIEFPVAINKHTRKLPVFEFKCQECGVTKNLNSTRANLNKKFCGHKCHVASVGGILGSKVKGLSKTEYLFYRNERQRRYYHEHKHEPQFQARIKKYNDRYLLRRKKLSVKLKKKKTVHL